MRVPKQAKRVFGGEVFSIYQWKQKLFDGSVGTFEIAQKRDTAVVLAIHKGKIVIARQKQPDRKLRYYSFLAGRVEDGETHRTAAKRELLEESGLIPGRLKLRKKYDDLHRITWPIYVYIAQDCRMVQKPTLDPGEKINLVYLTFEEFVHIMESGKLPARSFENDIFRMDKKGTLGEFKKALFG